MSSATEILEFDERQRRVSQLVHDYEARWRRDYGVRGVAWRMYQRDGNLDDRVVLHVYFREGPQTDFTILRSEIEMGDELANIQTWLRWVTDGIRHEWERRLPQRSPDPRVSPRQQRMEAMRQLIDNVHLTSNPVLILNHEAVFREFFGVDWVQDTKEQEAANEKARDLFLAVAGEEAYRALEAGKPLPIRGSQGTPYLLYKQASFCIERPADGARLCAVVPGVPLWDHLLGVKLMVEHDEPAFLATANVAGGYGRVAPRRLVPHEVTRLWIDESQEIPAEQIRPSRVWRY